MTPERRDRILSSAKSCHDRQLAEAVASGLRGGRLSDLMNRLNGFILGMTHMLESLPISYQDHAMRLFYDIHVNTEEEILRDPVEPDRCREVLVQQFDLMLRHRERMKQGGLDEDEVRTVWKAVTNMIRSMVSLSDGLSPDVIPLFTRFALERNRGMLVITAT